MTDHQQSQINGNHLQAPQSQGVRPVAIGEFLFKLATMYSLEDIGQDIIRSLFPEIQVGVAVKGGAEQALHQIQSLLETADSSHVFIKVDFSNAFNSCSRQQLLKSFLSHDVLAPAFNLFFWAYSDPSPLLYYNFDKLEHVLSSSEGGRQGDPLMPLAFSLLAQSLYVKGAEYGTTLVADLDDLGIEGPIQSAFASYDKIAASAPQYQLQLNPRKTRVFSFDRSSPVLREECAKRGLQLEEGEVMEWLGGLVGNLESEEAKAFCIRKVESLRLPLFQQALLHPRMPPVIALNIVRACLIPVLNFISRVLPPTTTAPALHIFDEMVSNFVATVLKSNSLDTAAKLQQSLPVSGTGGLGLISGERLAHSAYVSSLLLAMPRLAQIYESHPDAKVFQRLESGLSFLFDHGVPRGRHLPSEVAHCVFSFRDPEYTQHFKLQHWISQQLHSNAARAYLDDKHENPSLLKITDARMKSAGGAHASDWFLHPHPTKFLLSRNETEIATRLRLGDVFCSLDTPCPRCKKPLVVSGDALHHLCFCPCVRLQVIFRHDGVMDALEKAIREAGLQVEREPRDRQEEHVRPDCFIYGLRPGQKVAVDVSIAHYGESVLSSAPISAQIELKAAAAREKAKCRKFEAIVKANGDVFVPFVVETWGAIGQEARKLLKEISELLPESRKKEWLKDAYCGISCDLQRGNAAMWRAGVKLAKQD